MFCLVDFFPPKYIDKENRYVFLKKNKKVKNNNFFRIKGNPYQNLKTEKKVAMGKRKPCPLPPPMNKASEQCEIALTINF